MTKFFDLNEVPVFEGTPGYVPLPLETTWEEMTPRQRRDEIRHYIDIDLQKRQWKRRQERMRHIFTRKRA